MTKSNLTFGKTDLKEVERIARDAGLILLEYSQKMLRVVHKADGAGLVTDADTASEEFIINELSSSFPGSSFLAEESGYSETSKPQADSGRCKWIIDPLDGTNNYAHGFPWYAVSIGLEIDKEIVLGVIYQPVLKELFSALTGHNAHLNNEKIRVSKTDNLNDALLSVGFYYSRDGALDEEVSRFGRVHQKALGIRRPGSAALDMAYVACGRFDGFWERGLSPWDVAAGWVIAGEAGARFSDYSGNPCSIYKRELLLTNGNIHEDLIGLLK